MGATYIIHIVAGSAGLLSGYAALFTTKGAPLHRRAGIVFVVSMLAMCGAGFLMAVVRGVAPWGNVPAALLTAAMVTTAFTTVRVTTALTRRIDSACTIVTGLVGIGCLLLAAESIANGGRGRGGFPTFPFLLFGVPAVLATLGDLRVRRRGPLAGAARIARHLWRMSFALLIAALSFFIGQADEFPAWLRIYPLLALPVVVVLVAMFYWLWRVRWRRSLRGLQVAAPLRALP